jgi:hypothetical protein
MNQLLAIVCVLTLVAQVEHTPIPRDPKPDWAPMSFLIGSWTCSVASSRRPQSFAQHVTTTISPDGYWLVTRTITDKVPWNPITITNTDYITYDKTTQRWIDMSMDDYGAYDVSSSPGWTGQNITWTEIAYPRLHGAATNDPRIFKKLDDTHTETDTSFTETAGQRVTIKTTCAKNL